jgi:hypothetical protein
MAWRTSPALVAALAASCAPAAPPAIADELALFHLDLVGLSLLVPPGWVESREGNPPGTAWVLSGPRGSPDFHTTLTLQLVPDRGESFDDIVDDTLSPLADLPHFRFLGQSPRVVAGAVALQYAAEVELHESLRLRHAVLLPAGGLWIDVAGSATPDLFAELVQVFETALDSAALAPPP